MYLQEEFIDRQGDPIVSGDGALGVVGIDVPISGSPAAKGGHFYKVTESGHRKDYYPQQVTTSDLVEVIQDKEQMKPNYTYGIKVL